MHHGSIEISCCTGTDLACVSFTKLIPVDDGSFDLGEISFHHTLSFHTAGANRTNESRMALATTYFEDGARLVSSPTMISGEFHKFMPAIEPGDIIDSEYNSVCYSCTD